MFGKGEEEDTGEIDYRQHRQVPNVVVGREQETEEKEEQKEEEEEDGE